MSDPTNNGGTNNGGDPGAIDTRSPFDILREQDQLLTGTGQRAAVKPQVKNLTIRHDLILNWLIANPDRPMRECADHFNVTQAWLSIIVHSDVFQARLRERQETLFSNTVLDTREKLQTLSHVALDRLTEAVEQSDDPEFILDAADKALHRLGYAPRTGSTTGPAVANTQVNINIDRATLTDAQQLMQAARAIAAPKPDADDDEPPRA